LLLLLPVLFGVSVLVFATIRQLPGDPALAILGPRATPEQVELLRAEMRLDDPLVVQYLDWIGNAFRGDLGTSNTHKLAVTALIEKRLPVTIELVILAMVISVAVGIPSGILSAVQQNTPTDLIARVLNVAALSIPSFWLATLFLLLPSLWWGYSPPIGAYRPIWEDPSLNLEMFYMPAICLAASSSAATMRMMRSSVLEVMRSDYVRTARAKGLREGAVVWGHVIKNALIPVVSIIGLQVGFLLGGQVVVEQIFTLPGIGSLLVDSILRSDYLVVQAIVLYIALAVVLVNLLVDIMYAVLDPRIKMA
jgi:peptide/nickel transport system permease protein